MNKIESIVLNDKKILINICDKDNIVSDVDANIMLDNNVNAIDIIESIKLPKKPGLITLSDYDIYNYFHNSGNWRAEIFRFTGKIDFGNLKERISNTKKMYIAVLVGLDVSLFDIYDMIESIHDGLDCEILVMPAPDDKLNDNEIKVSVFYKD